MSRVLPVACSLDPGGGSKLDIALVETDRLLLHEETIPEVLRALAHRIEEDGVLKAPVIVDHETLVVLDGMHRVEALRMLGCQFTCVCLVDYRSPEIRVERWCRTVSNPFNAGIAAEIVRELGLRLTPLPMCRASYRRDDVSVMIFRDASFEVEASVPGLIPAFDAVRAFELRLRALGFEVGYETDREAEEKLASGAVGAVLCPPQVGKRQVIETASRGRVFTFKVTRHIVQARPVGVDVPLSLLRNSSLSLEEANERLSALLHGKRLRFAPSGGLWDGRRYDEKLYVFEEA